ncbi:hypothetical protein QR680_018683 [Steinernema hermaphroditum]|uniref:Uncharacterized protein n=1 Tax=Steinernema hermaphroditum TaxID=289476 RepID=A0AA39LQQ4_9BILA|nr:hypothetical protein QR680_018683 [Steinernema hermaphroditum]
MTFLLAALLVIFAGSASGFKPCETDADCGEVALPFVNKTLPMKCAGFGLEPILKRLNIRKTCIPSFNLPNPKLLTLAKLFDEVENMPDSVPQDQEKATPITREFDIPYESIPKDEEPVVHENSPFADQ